MKNYSAQRAKKTYLWVAVIIVIVALGLWGLLALNQQSTKLDSFASCIQEKGATFYGAFWCPHCQAQKALFKRSSRLLPYVECSEKDGRTQTQACTEKNISTYPTWQFADGTTQTGTLSLDQLAEKTGCVIPEEAR
jgi:thiol-disulfide isomerase/thioredoxin